MFRVAGAPARILERAIESWQRCDGYGVEFPRFVVDSNGSRSVLVRFVPGSSGTRRCGSFVASTITVYAHALDPEGRPRLCGDLAVNLAHELGHVLGLADQHDAPACDRTIMAQSPERRQDRRRVSSEECGAVAARWTVATSAGPANSPSAQPPSAGSASRRTPPRARTPPRHP